MRTTEVGPPLELESEMRFSQRGFRDFHEFVTEVYEQEIGALIGLAMAVDIRQRAGLSPRREEAARLNDHNINFGVYRLADVQKNPGLARFSNPHPALADGVVWLSAINPETGMAVVSCFGEEAGIKDGSVRYRNCFATVMDVAKRIQDVSVIVVEGENLTATADVLVPRIRNPQVITDSVDVRGPR